MEHADAVIADCDLVVPRLAAEPWYVDQVALDGACLSVAGWSMPVSEREPDEGWFTVNGRRFDRIGYPLPRVDVGAVFWQREGSSRWFRACATLPATTGGRESAMIAPARE